MSIGQSRHAFFALAVVFLPALAMAQEEEPGEGWPREIEVSGGSVVMYQPQPETFEGDKLTGRAAVSVTPTGEEPSFGTVWFEARIETDREERTAVILELEVTRVGFPSADSAQADQLDHLLEAEIPTWELNISLDRLIASLELAENRSIVAEGLNMDPPVILFSLEPAILVTIDGEPRLQEVEGSDLMRVINTPFTILFDRDGRTYYLYGDEEAWYTAPEVKGPWSLTDSVPSEVAALAPQAPEEEEPAPEDLPEGAEAEQDEEEAGPPPAIFVATEPSELIVIEGDPEYTPISGIDLMYVSNTESDVLLDLELSRYFVILSGRWFSSESLEGPWVNVPFDELPERYAQIPADSVIGHVLVSVPGTEQAEEAVLDNQVPQTAAINRDATLEVEYDGEPQFEPIEETDLQYAVNTADPIILVGDEYYACHEAVWYVSKDPKGPYTVTDSVPEAIYEIPPTSPVYNVTYVYVYESTPDVVYVGYYPGYVGSYVYGGTIVYGTGWYYPGWYGRYYYPRPATWGFHVRWNPWFGWSFGFGWGWGGFRFGIGWGGWHRGGWWGPGRYRGYRRGYNRGYRRGARAGYRAGSRAARNNNIYGRQSNAARNAAQERGGAQGRGQVAQNRANNVYSGRDGNVYRQNQSGNWEQRGRDGWQGNETVNRDAQRDRQANQQRQQQQRQQSGANRSRGSTGSQLERSSRSRSRGTSRTQNSSRSRGGRRGGGRRR